MGADRLIGSVHHDFVVDVSADEEVPVAPGYDTGEDTRGERAVFGLIGTLASDGRRPAQPGHAGYNEAMTGECDLIETLHDQYWRALADPQTSLGDDWAAQEVDPVADNRSADIHEGHLPERESPVPTGSIEALVSGSRTLESLFGPLEGMEAAGLDETGAVPEILRLFAPAGYHAAALRRPVALLPALTRREHHTPGLDSPLRVSDADLREEAI